LVTQDVRTLIERLDTLLDAIPIYEDVVGGATAIGAVVFNCTGSGGAWTSEAAAGPQPACCCRGFILNDVRSRHGRLGRQE
jgi:hypothetical protein